MNTYRHLSDSFNMIRIRWRRFMSRTWPSVNPCGHYGENIIIKKTTVSTKTLLMRSVLYIKSHWRQGEPAINSPLVTALSLSPLLTSVQGSIASIVYRHLSRPRTPWSVGINTPVVLCTPPVVGEKKHFYTPLQSSAKWNNIRVHRNENLETRRIRI